MDRAFEGFTPLIWGVKASLVSYVRKLDDGVISARLPAEWASRPDAHHPNGVERFIFAPDPDGSHFDTATQTGQLRFKGAALFTGHFNTMRVELVDPLLDLQGGAGTLSVRTNGAIGTPRWDAVAIAVVIPNSNRTQGLSVGLALTAAGRLLFGQQYPVGEPLDAAYLEKLQSFSQPQTKPKKETA